jgi:hypothetical protein
VEESKAWRKNHPDELLLMPVYSFCYHYFSLEFPSSILFVLLEFFDFLDACMVGVNLCDFRVA